MRPRFVGLKNNVYMEWIKVSDKLPKLGQTVLLIWGNGVEIGRLPVSDGERDIYCKRFLYHGKMKFFILQCEDIIPIHEILYWLEIPDLPKP